MAENNQEAPKNPNNSGTEVHLNDDKHPREDSFQGATLEISGDGVPRDPEVDFAGPGLNRNRPGSTIGRQSVRSTTSQTSMKPGGFQSEKQTETFFSYKKELDGKVLGNWLLAEIDHWDNEREKLLLLTENSLLVFRYNFINSTIQEKRRIMLHIIDTIHVGDFTYPEWSIMPVVSADHSHGGIQIKWNRGELPSFGQRWNPWCSTIPWVSLAHHPILYNPKETETITYNVDEFYEALIDAISKAYSRKRPGEKVTVAEGPILIESYASLTSMVFNQSSVGYCKDRNGLCF
ncbi:TPRGL-like protein [Mya arenaria]|uniref:TPRGL-like protein n=1 Tax=Mya arenaria TaxID=6604 RepID=A0ABY7F0N8_MYAAR|nr:TPRGL-like protein [Mya arenaria]